MTPVTFLHVFDMHILREKGKIGVYIIELSGQLNIKEMEKTLFIKSLN